MIKAKTFVVKPGGAADCGGEVLAIVNEPEPSQHWWRVGVPESGFRTLGRSVQFLGDDDLIAAAQFGFV